LKHDCYGLDIDGRYYVFQDKAGNIIFSGIKGFTNIELDEKNWWMIDNIRISKESGLNEIAVVYGRTPTGIQSWKSSFICYDFNNLSSEIQIKMQNVNIYFSKY